MLACPLVHLAVCAQRYHSKSTLGAVCEVQVHIACVQSYLDDVMDAAANALLHAPMWHACERTFCSKAPRARLANTRACTGDHDHLALERCEVRVLGQWVGVGHGGIGCTCGTRERGGGATGSQRSAATDTNLCAQHLEQCRISG
jgi:hypothetical protein